MRASQVVKRQKNSLFAKKHKNMFGLEPITTKLFIHSSITVHFWKEESFLDRKPFPNFSLCKIKYAEGGAIYKSFDQIIQKCKKKSLTCSAGLN